MSTYNKPINNPSQYFLMNFISNITSNSVVEKEKNLFNRIDAVAEIFELKLMQQAIGHWKVVWGPALKTTKQRGYYYTDNAMYMAQSIDDPSQYFIGIAGTNGISQTGWFAEDFAVTEMVNWPPAPLGLPPGTQQGKISKGAAAGLAILWQMNRHGVTLIDFIKKEFANSPSTLAIGGHSLGGCLTPVLGAAIADVLKAADQQAGTNDYKNVAVHAYPTAGPTPGNKDFAHHLTQSLTGYHHIYNANDVVPLAWDFTGLEAARKNYGSWHFGGRNIDTHTRLTNNWLVWAQGYPSQKVNQYAPVPQSEHFIIETWSNVVIQMPRKDYKKASLAMGYLLRRQEIAKQLKRIVNGDNINSNEKEVFINFFIQMGLQHVNAYTTQQPSAPIHLDPDLLKSLERYFKPLGSRSKWRVRQAIDLFKKLATIAADWLAEHQDALPTVALEPATEAQAVEAFTVDPATEAALEALSHAETDEEVEAALEKSNLFADGDFLLPFGFELVGQQVTTNTNN